MEEPTKVVMNLEVVQISKSVHGRYFFQLKSENCEVNIHSDDHKIAHAFAFGQVVSVTIDQGKLADPTG